LKWDTTGRWCETKDSFIFSFKNMNIKDAILSKVINTEYALDYSTKCGPQFGRDLVINSYKYSDDDEYTIFNVTYCKNEYYERRIRDTRNYFSIEDYEVFQIIRK
jgi:hypothetical protein